MNNNIVFLHIFFSFLKGVSLCLKKKGANRILNAMLHSPTKAKTIKFDNVGRPHFLSLIHSESKCTEIQNHGLCV